MPTWSGILGELMRSRVAGGQPDFDGVRRRYLVLLYQHTGRNTILYATKFTQPDPNISPELISISDEDLEGLMEVIHGLSGSKLDLVLHSPGGSLEAAEALVSYLRSKFSHIRVVVPQLAMSAATMIACAADSIVLGKHSSLGPIDPQFITQTSLGQRAIPAQAILDQFDIAKRECQDPTKMGAWLPMLSQYGPDLLVRCSNALKMSRSLVCEWLEEYMFKGDPDATSKAKRISDWLADHSTFLSHGRHIPRPKLEAQGLKIEHLEADQKFQDLVLSLFHATTHTLAATPAVKIIENHLGKAFIKSQVMMQVTPPVVGPGMKPPSQGAPTVP